MMLISTRDVKFLNSRVFCMAFVHIILSFGVDA